MNYYVDENVAKTVRVFPMQGRREYQRFDMNENPEGLPLDFVETVKTEITPEFLSTYPEPDRFLSKYANFLGVKQENVMATNGSDTAIRYILEVFGEKGKEVVTVSPTFEMYSVNCSLLNLKHVPVFYEKNYTINTQKIVAAINENTSIVVLLNPNNPMGNVYTENEVNEIVDRAEKMKAIVVIDEAYHYFYEKTFLNFAINRKNVVILRTFSKLFSLAACRLGVIISNSQIIDYLNKIRLTFDVNSVALLFGEKLIEDPQLLSQLIAIENAGKKFIVDCLNQNNYEFIECKGNFILIKTIRDAHAVAEDLKNAKKILVHAYGNGCLREYIRVSIGSEEKMQFFVKAFLEVDSKKG